MKVAVISWKLFILIGCCLAALANGSDGIRGKDKTFWYKRNHELLKERIAYFGESASSLAKVKNVILVIGDGMGITTLAASRVFKRQKLKQPNANLLFDRFPASAFVQTDTANTQIAESAAAATALFCGVKTNFESLGVDATAEDICSGSSEAHTSSLMAWAQQQKVKTGSVESLTP